MDLVGRLQMFADDAGLTDSESDVYVRHELGASTAATAEATERAESTVRVLLMNARRKIGQHVAATLITWETHSAYKCVSMPRWRSGTCQRQLWSAAS